MIQAGIRKAVSAAVSIVGIAVLCYILGAAVIAYQLPSSGWLVQAFDGARQWLETKEAIPTCPTETPVRRGAVDRRGKTFDGFTLYTCAADKDLGTQAYLIDMQGREVHRWAVRFRDVWGDTIRVTSGGESVERRSSDTRVCFFGSYLYPNGDLLAVFHGGATGYAGLARLDKSSNVLWARPGAIHHDVDVGEDGTIYAVQQERLDIMPPELDDFIAPCLDDHLLVLSADGKELRAPISILSALHHSLYSAFLATLERRRNRHEPPAGSTAPPLTHVVPDADILHTNCVRVLHPDLAAAFPGFDAGQVLISIRNLNLLAMLDVNQGRVVWAARGPWLAQHDPQLLSNGHLLIFDNLGSPNGSRVLEYNVQTQAVPWSYTGDADGDFYTSERGMCQRLPNGNTFVVNSEGGEMTEVTPDKEVVWAYTVDRFITTARRYSAEQLLFLGNVSPRS